jgi:septum formation protein
MTRRLVLASGSAVRAAILRNAGISFEQISPGVDEAAIKARLKGEGPETIAATLAEAKAMAVAAPGALVLGCDQILEHRGVPYDKPATLAEARARLKALAGDEHSLVNATAIACDGRIAFRHLARPRLAMRALSDVEIDAYLSAAGEDVLSSVGGYQVERLGVRLFERIEGDFFAVQGLAILPVLEFLRGRRFGSF